MTRQRFAAFSLVELLVVIAIIGVLVAMLLPALGKARDTAKQVRCLANNHQINIGVGMYLNSNRYFFPVANGWSSVPSLYSATWGQVVAVEMGMKTYVTEWGLLVLPDCTQNLTAKSKPNGAFLCPAFTLINLWGGMESNDYSWNASTYGMGDGDIWGSQLGIYNTDIWWQYYGRRKLPQITRPDSTVMFREFFTPGSSVYEYGPGFGGATTISGIHNGGSNVSWVDGHATSISNPAAFDVNYFKYNQ